MKMSAPDSNFCMTEKSSKEKNKKHWIYKINKTKIKACDLYGKHKLLQINFKLLKITVTVI